MELSIKKEILMNGIQIVQNTILPKTSLPILSNVLLEAEEGILKLTATDLEIGISTQIPVTVTQIGALAVPAKKFFEIIRSLPDGNEISLSVKKNNFLTIKSDRAQFKIFGLPKEDFPQIPVFKNTDAVNMEQRMLKNMLDLTDFAISREDTRYVLNGILFIIKEDGATIVAADGRRLAVVNKTLAQKTILDKQVIIPAKTVQEVKRMLTDEGEITIKFGENQILFSFPTSFILSKLIEGEYPSYKRIIPEKTDKYLRVARENFLAAAQRASIFTDQDSQAIKLGIKKKKMMISKNTPYLGEVKEEIDIDYTGQDEFEIGFNPKYLMDVLRNLEDEEILFEIEAFDKPGVVRKGEEYTYVVLPMQVVG